MSHSTAKTFFYPPQVDLLKGPLWGHNLISFCLTSSPIQHFFLGWQMNEWWMFRTVLQISWNFDLNNIIITTFGGGCEGRGVVLRCTRLRCTGLWQRTRNTTSSIQKKTPGTNGDFEFIFLNTPDFESKFSLTVLIVDFLFNTLLNYFRWRIILPQTAFLL